MAANHIFRLKNLADCFSFDHNEDLYAVFTREGPLKKTLHSVWGCSGHLFLSLDGGTMVRAYQMKTSLKVKQFTILAKISPIVQICFARDTQDIILVVHKNGLVKVYEHIQPEDSGKQPWRKRAQFTLGTYTHLAAVKSALICSNGSRLLWVEERREVSDSSARCYYCVLTARLEPYSKNIQPPTELLSNCPTSLDIAATHNGNYVTILPKPPCPPGLYFRLHVGATDGTLTLGTSIIGEGTVQRDSSFSVDYKLHADRLIHIWSEVANKPYGNLVAMAIEQNTGKLFLVSGNGSVHTVSQKEETVEAFPIPQWNVSQVSSWFAHRFVIGAVFDQEHLLRFYSTTSGALLQEIDLTSLTSSNVVHPWCMLGNIPSVGVWSKEGVWILQMQEASTAARADTANSKELLKSFGLNKMAASVELERAYGHYASGAAAVAAAGNEPSLELLCNDEIYQNEALLVSLLEGAEECHRPHVTQKLSELQQDFEQRRDHPPDTSLNESMSPLLRDFWQIQSQRDRAMKDELATKGGTTVSDEVRDAVKEDSLIPLDLRLARLELISQQFPARVLQCLLSELDLEKELENDEILEPPVTASSPPQNEDHPPVVHPIHQSLCNPDTDEGCRFLKMLCHLLFLQRPSKLIQVVELFQQARQTAADASAFTRRRHGVPISSIIVDTLPDPTLSVDVTQAVKAQAYLIRNSDKDHGPIRALRLLLNYSMWEDAIQVVMSHDPVNGQSHRELFLVLFSAMLMDYSALEEYSNQLWECLPASITALNLLQALQINHEGISQMNQSKDASKLSSKSRELSTSLMKEQLIKMLAKEQSIVQS